MDDEYKLLSRNLTDCIERNKDFEEILGITYENISVNIIDGDEIKIFADLKVVDKEKFQKNGAIETTVTLYDNENFILDMRKNIVNVKDFLGMETLDVYYNYKPNFSFVEISKIRIFPK